MYIRNRTLQLEAAPKKTLQLRRLWPQTRNCSIGGCALHTPCQPWRRYRPPRRLANRKAPPPREPPIFNFFKHAPRWTHTCTIIIVLAPILIIQHAIKLTWSSIVFNFPNIFRGSQTILRVASDSTRFFMSNCIESHTTYGLEVELWQSWGVERICCL